MEFIRPNTLRRCCLILLILLILPLEAGISENVGTSITIGIQSTKTLTIRPFEPLERDILSIYNVIYESLVTIDDDYLLQGCIAESWEENSGGKVWTFHLRSDVRFSDGTPLTANDVVASANYILDKARDENITDHGFYSNLASFVKKITEFDQIDHNLRQK